MSIKQENMSVVCGVYVHENEQTISHADTQKHICIK